MHFLFADNNCKGICSGYCTGDGRPYDSLAGLGGPRTVVLDDNVMCTKNDPYDGKNNILVHEFAHTVHRFGLPDPSYAQMVRMSTGSVVRSDGAYDYRIRRTLRWYVQRAKRL